MALSLAFTRPHPFPYFAGESCLALLSGKLYVHPASFTLCTLFAFPCLAVALA